MNAEGALWKDKTLKWKVKQLKSFHSKLTSENLQSDRARPKTN